AAKGTLGLVPTMGALHEGHLSLVRRARTENALVAASIFVNPLQFGAGEDFDRYPRTEEEDLAMLEQEGVDLVLLGQAADLYPDGFATTLRIDGPLGAELEAARRPGHFDGVATVVAKLLLMFRPARAYFGWKDFQQCCVVRRLVADLSLPVEVVCCEVVREDDGLALSSRNRYLSAAARAQAPRIHAALAEARAAAEAGERDVERLVALVVERLGPPFELEYVAVRDERDFAPVDRLDDDGLRPRILCVAGLEGVRLLDNLPLPGRA
ncbi:MAG: pantoate--beta-alanine ligase, partial [Planctomycetota bacterium]